MPNYKDLSRSGAGEADADAREHEEEDSDDFSMRAKGPLSLIVSLYALPQRTAKAAAAPKATLSGPYRPAPAMSSHTISHKATAVDFSRTISSDSAELDDEGRVDLASTPPTPLPPAFPPPIAKSKSSIGAKSRKRKESRIRANKWRYRNDEPERPNTTPDRPLSGIATFATDLSLPHLINIIPPPSSSPKGKSSALLTAAKHCKGHLDKAMRYLDSDSTPDKCTDPI
ncbi:hypothetical protein EI94DRAFT_1798676 [Lactarius quietus]|nr:hypothetical protein EI94DRAFT_1798676 [Lactarius quietus]